DGSAVLALPDISPERQRLAEGDPALDWKTMFDHRIVSASSRVLRHGERRFRRRRVPGLDPGHAAGLKLVDNLGGDFVVKARPIGAERARAACLDIADLRDGGRKPLSQPSTRHGNPVRTLPLGALRGVPAEGSAETTGSAAGEGFPHQTAL